MTKQPNILVFSGSIRKESVNTKLASRAAHIIDGLDAKAILISLVDYDLPLYNGDFEDEHGVPDNAIKLKKIMVEHDGILITSPEYNSGFTPLLKNTIDWVSRQHDKNEDGLIAYTGKPYAICSASPGGLGGIRGLVMLRMVLGNVGAIVCPKQACIPGAFGAFNEDGSLKSEQHEKMLAGVCGQLVELVG